MASSSSSNPSSSSASHRVGLDSIKRILHPEKQGNDDQPTPTAASIHKNKRAKTLVEQTPSTVSTASSSTTTSTSIPVTVTPKRQNCLTWDEYFLAICVLSARRSKDPHYRQGACLVDEQNRIVGIGYNGFPRGCSDDALPWQGPSSSQSNDKDNSTEDIPWLHTYEPYLCTAISNAILNKCSDTVRGCTLYCMSFPSSDCSKLMVQSQIATVVVLGSENEQTSPDLQASRILLDMAGVQVRYYQPNRELVTLNFSSPSSSAVQEQPQTNNETKNATSNTNLVTDRERAILKEEIDYDPLHSENGSKKRTDYLSWKDYFMAMAFLTSQRSKDPNTQVGACIVDSSSNRILGLGYNGFPRGCSDDRLPWARVNANPLHNKYLYVCHAEVNAILNKGSANVQGATLYVDLFPCHNCAKLIVQSGIHKVVYMRDSYRQTDSCRASRVLLELAQVQLEQYTPSVPSLELNYTLGQEESTSNQDEM